MDIPKRLLSLFILIIFITTDISHAKTVKIFNDLGYTLQFHCKSKDIDLGHQSLIPGGMWSFHFERNFFGRSLFFCSFDLPYGRRWFDIYEEPRDTSIVPTGVKDGEWRITPSGPCMYDEYRKQLKECLPWNNN
ncbi:unnamed protein product [Eruca vesicaria subsp. sativa]|uniref:S-protein homolog n=1 Tax=Eruca vesicaria subsp. sativa TaxID=29727 RepID=A0ABC8LUA6_ERUVS|nr:unnamed protein product [Eruca vesicaria subsp. sativa]